MEPTWQRQTITLCGNSPLPARTISPIGQVVQILGSDAASDVDLVCCKHDLPVLSARV